MKTRREIFEAHYWRYQRAGKKEKGKILEEVAGTTGLNRDHLAHVLASYGKTQRVKGEARPTRRKRAQGKRGGRPSQYQEKAFVALLTRIGEDYGRPCGKLLAPLIRGIIDFLVMSKEPDYGINEAHKALLMKVSGAQIDRLLAPARKALEMRGISTTRAAGASLRSPVPVQTHFDREAVKPGDFAFDTVAHCGGSASGQFCKTLTGTSPYSGWVEERSLLNRANKWVAQAIEDIRSTLPFPLTAGHYDNGMEFINKPLLEWCLAKHIRASRSRPYRKNDNCFAEQKNYDAVRQTVGYFRFDTPAEQEALAEVYKYLCPLYNYWYPSFRLTDKEKQEDGRYKKIYEKSPKTSYPRLFESEEVSEASKAELTRRKSISDPVVLNSRLNRAVGRLLKINREKDKVEQPS
ncbi:MAG: transposase family protein [Treponema sp.]|jgi:hypothetical protein|nr:transposase family protein [Treponema sp.]